MEEPTERAKLLFSLWTEENSVVSQKTNLFVATEAILVAAVVTSPSLGWLVTLVGLAVSANWLLSVGRTLRYRDHWRRLLSQEGEVAMFPPAARTVLGWLPSRLALLSLPLAGVLMWLLLWVFPLRLPA